MAHNFKSDDDCIASTHNAEGFFTEHRQVSAAGDDHRWRNRAGAVPAGPARRATVAAAPLRVNWWTHRCHLYYSVDGSCAVLDICAGPEDTQLECEGREI